jgi:lipopolysaccharide/colanic/teichoic acid biosynthesis glycosyltransferase
MKQVAERPRDGCISVIDVPTEMVKLGTVWVANWSLWNDVKLIVRTPPALLTGRGTS